MEQKDQAALQSLQARLDQAAIQYEILAHDMTIATAEEGARQGIGSLSAMAPTFILKTEQGYMAAIVSGSTRLAYKKIKKELGLKDVSLTTPDLAREITGAEVGYISMVNPNLPTLMDQRLLDEEVVYGGCGIPQHTLKINPRDLAALMRAHIFDFTEARNQ